MFDITNTDNLLDTKFNPGGLHDDYGTDEVKVAVERFCDLPNANGCDIMKIQRESGMK